MLHQSIFESGSAAAVSLPEVVGAFSYTLDIGKGRPPGHSVRTCWIGMHVGRARHLPADELSDLYYVLLLANSALGQLHVSSSVSRGISGIGEHWDGSGRPGRLSGAAIPITSRIALLAQVADLTFSKSGVSAAVREVNRLSGTWLDPDLARSFAAVARVGFLWTQLSGPLLDARVAMLAPDQQSAPASADLLGDITVDLGRMLRSQNVDPDCIAAFRRAGITGR